MSLKSALDDVAAFNRACEVVMPSKPQFLDRDSTALIMRLVAEEAAELDDAMHSKSMVEVADAMCDLIYVTLQGALKMGIPLDRIWDEVQRSNMAKIEPGTGKVRRREDGKILKPEGWKSPTEAITDIIAEHSK